MTSQQPETALFFTPLFWPPGIGSLSFQQSSTWTQSWRSRSKTLKTSWPQKATRGRAASLTWTACEWLGCQRLFLLLTIWMKVSVSDYVSAPFYCCSQTLPSFFFSPYKSHFSVTSASILYVLWSTYSCDKCSCFTLCASRNTFCFHDQLYRFCDILLWYVGENMFV